VFENTAAAAKVATSMLEDPTARVLYRDTSFIVLKRGTND
jgi:hypothetical protein